MRMRVEGCCRPPGWIRYGDGRKRGDVWTRFSGFSRVFPRGPPDRRIEEVLLVDPHELWLRAASFPNDSLMEKTMSDKKVVVYSSPH